jgi:predicted ArsR family transcriptional regulator
MTNDPAVVDPVAAIALLDEPTRRQIFESVSAAHDPVGRDDVAAELGISRELAAFHLERLLDGGLLKAEYRRRSGRTGPGAGRPAKLYSRTDREIAISFPSRRYQAAADVFAEGIARLEDPAAIDAVADVARERGRDVGLEASRVAGARPSRRRRLAALMDLLSGAGYEPAVDKASGAVQLRNCPYHALVADHRELTCGMNLAWAQGVADAADLPLRPVLAGREGVCCVEFQRADPRGTGQARDG